MNLHSGGQGEVRKAVYKNHKVAAKSIYGIDEFSVSSFLTEIQILSSLSHPNVIK